MSELSTHRGLLSNTLMRSFEFSVAPMLDVTDRHCRYMLHLIAPHFHLYSEMITTGAILMGDADRHLRTSKLNAPQVLQLGGSDPIALAQAVQQAQAYPYSEINLNVGCPSSRVQAGRFGASLMKEPHLVAQCIKAMQEVTDRPITIKTRIGIDNCDSEVFLHDFVAVTRESGCQKFIIHARKAWLKGLSPKQNRNIPPLNYQRVYDLKQQFSDLTIVINGGVENIAAIKQHLLHVDGVMIGRPSYLNPAFLAECETVFFQQPPLQREQVVERYLHYCQEQAQQGVPWRVLTRPMVNLYNGLPGAKAWRRRCAHEFDFAH